MCLQSFYFLLQYNLLSRFDSMVWELQGILRLTVEGCHNPCHFPQCELTGWGWDTMSVFAQFKFVHQGKTPC
ncbi:hypothetical protein XELAEV_18039988mg [Xenopus laevis]|uniref:Uncharacterized protein n=1 Tax=Xenopus laevis TaxID=8355 RepID=A0A974C9U3_XENLA|nr:hypothetical protein XELAEV_18039988mg [Xenopus laevis]